MGGGGSSEMRQLQERVEGMERRMGMLERLVGALQGIVNGLKDDGVPTATGVGGWHVSTVQRVLQRGYG